MQIEVGFLKNIVAPLFIFCKKDHPSALAGVFKKWIMDDKEQC